MAGRLGSVLARRERWATVVIGLALIGLAAPASARSFVSGIQSGDFVSADAGLRESSFGETAAAGAGIVRIPVDWSSVAPSAPVHASPENPANPDYHFSLVDAAVRDASSRGLRIVLVVVVAPSWAEGAGRPADARAGSWRPDPSALASFSKALARRYGGAFSDPLQPGAALPRVRYYQAWNEPNLNTYLSPQWSNGHAESPDDYRALLNSFYGAVKSVDPRDVVISAGTAPYGDPGQGERIRPVLFLRKLFCLQGRRRLRPQPCPADSRFDVLAHQPINAFRPTRPATNPDDATTPDIGRIRRVLHAAQRAGRVSPRGHKPIWVTEFWWESKPPTARGVPPLVQARYVEQALFEFWRQRVAVAIYLQMRDEEPTSNVSIKSGLEFQDGTPKPAFQAFRFPFVTERSGRGRVLAWGYPPSSGRVRIQRHVRGHWRTLRRIAAHAHRPFAVTLRINGHASLRAAAPFGSSLVWHQH